jgi:ribosomal protein L13E
MAKCRFDWAEVQRAYNAGLSPLACCLAFGFTRGAWQKACKSERLRVCPGDENGRKRSEPVKHYDWAEAQRYYDDGHTFRDCMKRFGFASASWAKAVRRGDLRARSREWPVERVLSESKSRLTVKRTLLKAGILKNECEECGLSEWRGRPLSIQIDHRNDRRSDHRLENLRMLCPNCHSQTETYGARNRRPKPFSALIADIAQLNYSRVV